VAILRQEKIYLAFCFG